MFDDFSQQATGHERGRRSVSALLSLGIFGGLALLIGGAVTAHHVQRQRAEREEDVTFADLPAAQLPKPKLVAAPKAARKAAPRRQPVVDLKAIPTTRPQEAEGDLAAADDTGAVDGIIEAKAPPPAPPPVVVAPPPPPKPEVVPPPAEQERDAVAAPRFVSGCRAPDVPPALLGNAATIRIEVEMMIDEHGRVTSSRVVVAHPVIPNDLILACANSQVFAPAQLSDGTPVPYPFRRRFVFKPAQA